MSSRPADERHRRRPLLHEPSRGLALHARLDRAGPGARRGDVGDDGAGGRRHRAADRGSPLVADLDVLADLAERAAAAVAPIAGTLSGFPERAVGGYYLDIDVDRAAVARYGRTTGDVQDVIRTAIGGRNVTTTVEGLARYPLNVRYARELRDDVPALRRVLVTAPTGAQIPLGDLATMTITPGPPMIRSENGQRTAWIFVDIDGSRRDLGGWVAEAQRVVRAQVPLPAGYSLAWSGRFEYLAQANRRLQVVIPITVALIVLLLFAATQSWLRVAVILLAVPFSLIGAVCFAGPSVTT